MLEWDFFKPVNRYAREHMTLIGDKIMENIVKGRNSVSGNN